VLQAWCTLLGNVRGTLYDVLGVPPSATTEEIRAAYRKLAQVYHPDKPTGDEAGFKQINEAHQVLCSSYRRGLYDMQLSTSEAQAIVKESIDPRVLWLNVLVSIVFIAIGITCGVYGDKPAPNYNGWLVILFWAFIALGVCRFKYREYRFSRYGEFLKAAFLDTAGFVLSILARYSVILILVGVVGLAGWILSLFGK
jgi:curved DNA-binding protein CbpA